MGNGHGTPVEAQAVMMARYLKHSREHPHPTKPKTEKEKPAGEEKKENNIPPHNHGNEPKPATDLQQFRGVLRPSGRGVIPKLVLRAGDAAEENDEGEKDDHKGHVGPQAAEQEDERHHRHNDVVVALAGGVWREDGGFGGAASGDVVCGCQWVRGVRGVRDVDPVHTVLCESVFNAPKTEPGWDQGSSRESSLGIHARYGPSTIQREGSNTLTKHGVSHIYQQGYLEKATYQS